MGICKDSNLGSTSSKRLGARTKLTRINLSNCSTALHQTYSLIWYFTQILWGTPWLLSVPFGVRTPVTAGNLHQLCGHVFRQLRQLRIALQGLTSALHEESVGVRGNTNRKESEMRKKTNGERSDRLMLMFGIKQLSSENRRIKIYGTNVSKLLRQPSSSQKALTNE